MSLHKNSGSNSKKLLPRKCNVFYSIVRAYRFGFGQAQFSWKVLGRNVLGWCALVVAGRYWVGMVPRKRRGFPLAGVMWPGKGGGKFWCWIAADGGCLLAPAGRGASNVWF